jgi:hypothetical protein
MTTETQNTTVDRRSGLSYEEFEQEYLIPGRPVVLTDVTKDWNALSRWTPDFFRKEFGDQQIKANDKNYSVRDFMDLVEASSPENPAPYLRNEYIPEVFPTLLKDVQPCPQHMTKNWLAGKFYVTQLDDLLNKYAVPEIYIGGAGGSFPFLHYDLCFSHASLSQVYGRKMFILYSPDQSEYVYPSPTYKNQSQVRNPDKADLTKFPLFAKAVPTVFTLDPGETVFIPGGWWHTAKMLTTSITVSVNHANGSNWKRFVRDFRHEVGRSHRLTTRLMARPIAGYLSAVGVVRGLAG